MTKNTIRERLTAYLDQKKISKSEFGRRIGVSDAFVTSIKKSISPEKLQRIRTEFPDLNLDWLQFGTGDMIVTAPIVAGDQNNVNNGHDQHVSTDAGLVAALREAQAQTSKSQQQIDRLLTIIETFQNSQK
jgi:transcriptional regulator with XRE-family HTH domain